jgi:hypothetical protein
MELSDVIVPPLQTQSSCITQQSPQQQQHLTLPTTTADHLKTFDSSRGYMRINSSTTDHPLIPTDTLNTQSLYNLLVKLQQTNKLELTDDSLTSSFYISSQELSSLLEPNQSVATNTSGGGSLTSDAPLSCGVGSTSEPNNNSLGIVNQNVFSANDDVDTVSAATVVVDNELNPMYYVSASEQESGGFFSANTLNEQSRNAFAPNEFQTVEAGQRDYAAVSNKYGCQELCCLLKFNALVSGSDNRNQLF